MGSYQAGSQSPVGLPNFRPVLFGVFINYLDVEIKCVLRKPASYTKVGGTLNSLKGRENLQKDVTELERWQSPTA